MAIVAGAPICDPARLEDTIREWEFYAKHENLGVCYFGAEERLQTHLNPSREYARVSLGCQPEWLPFHFLNQFDCDASLRAQLNRARNKGVQVREWRRSEAENNPQLRAILHEWLDTRGLPTLHFLVEPETLSELRDRRLFVAQISGDVVGFVTLCPIPARNGWLTEQFVRGHHAPNGTVELMLFEASKAICGEGAGFVTMGIVPLVLPENDVPSREPIWLNILRKWAKAHYIRFYNFRGLSEFKGKFHPDRWQPVVVIVKDSRFRIRHLRSIGRAFSQTMPELVILAGISKAVRTEIRTLRTVLSRNRLKASSLDRNLPA